MLGPGAVAVHSGLKSAWIAGATVEGGGTKPWSVPGSRQVRSDGPCVGATVACLAGEAKPPRGGVRWAASLGQAWATVACPGGVLKMDSGESNLPTRSMFHVARSVPGHGRIKPAWPYAQIHCLVHGARGGLYSGVASSGLSRAGFLRSRGACWPPHGVEGRNRPRQDRFWA